MSRLSAVLVSLLLAATPAGADGIAVAAAASLTDALSEIGRAFTRDTGVGVSFSFAGSSVLARQIEAGAPVDVFFSADEEKMDRLQSRGFIRPQSRRAVLSNSLVVVVPLRSATPIRNARDLLSPLVRTIAIGEPQSVPVGIYARQHLQSAGIWTAVAGKMLPTENARAALAAVESGNVEAGIVFRTDALASRRVRMACEIARSGTPPIVYPAAVTRDSPQPEVALRFLAYLGSETAVEIFQRHGFVMAD